MNSNKAKFAQKLKVFFKKYENEIREGGENVYPIKILLENRKKGGGIMTIDYISRQFLKLNRDVYFLEKINFLGGFIREKYEKIGGESR